MTKRLFGLAILAVVIAGAAPGSADHAAACKDDYFCESGGTAWSVSTTIQTEDGTIDLTADRVDLQRFSSQGHTESSTLTATMTLTRPDTAPVSCSPSEGSIVYDASSIINEIHVSSTDDTCPFDLRWESAGTPTASADRRTEVVPGIPTKFDTVVILSVGGTMTVDATVNGTAGGADVVGAGGTKEHHGYIGHVTVIPK